MKHFGEDPPFRACSEQWSREQGRRRERRRNEPSTRENVTRRFRISMQEFIFQAQGVDEFEQRLGGEKALRAKLESKSVFFLRGNDAAGASSSFQDARRDSSLLEAIGARET